MAKSWSVACLGETLILITLGDTKERARTPTLELHRQVQHACHRAQGYFPAIAATERAVWHSANSCARFDFGRELPLVSSLIQGALPIQSFQIPVIFKSNATLAGMDPARN